VELQGEHVHTAKNIREGVENSLRLLKTDHLDLVQFHRSLTMDDFQAEGALQEALKLKDEAERMYGIKVERFAPEMSLEEMERGYGPELWRTDPDRCCAIRKVEPLRKALSGLKAWITGIMRDQGLTRKDVPIVSWDEKYGLVKVNPLVRWSAQDVAAYARTHGVPLNPLHAQGYPSIGCAPCTTPVKPGEDPRAGRWRGSAKKECGLHVKLGFTSQPAMPAPEQE